MVARRGVLLLLLACACGARSEIAGGPGDDTDGAVDFDATTTSDAPSAAGDSPTSSDAAACTSTPPTVGIGFGNPDGASCKFSVDWTCGSANHHIGGGCDPPGKQGGLQGGCIVDGQAVATFDQPDATCLCTDAGALAAQVEGLCTTQ